MTKPVLDDMLRAAVQGGIEDALREIVAKEVRRSLLESLVRTETQRALHEHKATQGIVRAAVEDAMKALFEIEVSR
jgi:Rps23 Pro-64 3,4-dihydroxylase Tpa1-like proline 4-hydroxylase